MKAHSGLKHSVIRHMFPGVPKLAIEYEIAKYSSKAIATISFFFSKVKNIPINEINPIISLVIIGIISC